MFKNRLLAFERLKRFEKCQIILINIAHFLCGTCRDITAIFFFTLSALMHNVKKIKLTAFGKVSARLLNDGNDRNSTRRRYILLSSSDVSFFPCRSSRSSYRRGNRSSQRSIYKPLTCVQITHAVFFYLSTERLMPRESGSPLETICTTIACPACHLATSRNIITLN